MKRHHRSMPIPGVILRDMPLVGLGLPGRISDEISRMPSAQPRGISGGEAVRCVTLLGRV